VVANKKQKMSQSLVKNMSKLSRPIIFDGFTPKFQLTDIDFVWELKNKFLILGEVKEFGKDITIGQAITTTRIVDAWNSDPNKIGIIIFAQHHPDVTEIQLADCIVNKIYDGSWKELKQSVTVSKFIDMMISKYDITYLK
jgi:hypothetical protein